MKKHIFILLFSCLYCFSIIAQEFVHPGIIHKESDFARMRQKIAQKKEPWYTTYQNLKAHSGAQL